MKIKVGNKMYDAEKEPIMIILSKSDKENITNMLSTCTKYCCCPSKYTYKQIEDFMK